MDTFKLLGPLAWRNLWRNPRRTFITLIVVVIGIWSILLFSAFITAWSQSSRDATLKLLIAQGQIHAQGYLDDPNVDHLMSPPDDGLKAALNAPAIAHWVSRLELPAVVQSEYKTLPATVLGVDPAREAEISSIPSKIVEGRYLSGTEDDGVILGVNMVKRLKTALGRRVILMITGKDGNLEERSFDVVGVYDADTDFEDTYAFTGRQAMQDMVGVGDAISQISFEVPKKEDLPGVIKALQAAAPDLDTRPWRKLSLLLAAIDSSMAGVVYIWLSVMMVMISIGIINTQLMAVFERTHEFGLLRALGFKPRYVVWLVTFESVLLIGLGVLIGTALGALTIYALKGGVDLSAFGQALEAFKAGNTLYFRFNPSDYMLFPPLIWVLGVAVALWPSWRAARIAPVEAMRHET